MSSGGKREVFNSLERAISSDLNRAQSFVHTDMADMLKMLMLSSTSLTGAETLPSGVAAPLAMMIVNGFLVKPDSAGQTMLIDAGVAVINRPDTSPDGDDSTAKFVNDPGVTNTATLPWVANVSGSTRIDIVECAVVGEDGAGAGTGESVIETASRDIYNTTTGLFTPANVTKVSAVRFQYRVRHGTGGGGWPGTVAGWRPLAVISVPTGAATYGATTWFDVRPLFSDLAFNGDVKRRNKITHQHGHCGPTIGGSSVTYPYKTIYGTFEAVYAGRHIGGDIPLGGYDLDSGYYSAVNFATTACNVDGWWHLYLAVPFGLPRWARYTGTPLLPGSMRGIPVAIQIDPDGYTGEPVSAVALPSGLGFVGSTTTAAFRVFSGRSIGAGPQNIIAASVGPDGWYTLQITANIGPGAWTLKDSNVSGFDSFTKDIVEGTHVPPGATGVALNGQASWTPAGVDAILGDRNFEGYNGVLGAYIGTTATVGWILAVPSCAYASTFTHAAISGTPTATPTILGNVALPPNYPDASVPWSVRTWHLMYRQTNKMASETAVVDMNVVGYRL